MPGCESQDFTERVAHLKKEISRLDDYETLIDRHRLWIEQSIKNITEDIDTQKYLYITADDLTNCYGNENTVIVINAPYDTRMTFQVSCKLY